jgi:hypothetical protein
VYYGNPKSFEAKARIDIIKCELMDSQGFSSKALKEILIICENKKDLFLEVWHDTRF